MNIQELQGTVRRLERERDDSMSKLDLYVPCSPC